MLGGADNPNGELPSYITGADTIPVEWLELAVEQGFQEFRLRMSETKIKLVTK